VTTTSLQCSERMISYWISRRRRPLTCVFPYDAHIVVVGQYRYLCLFCADSECQRLDSALGQSQASQFAAVGNSWVLGERCVSAETIPFEVCSTLSRMEFALWSGPSP